MKDGTRHGGDRADGSGQESAVAPAHTPPPPARIDPVVDLVHGVPVADPYRWLEDQDSPETRAWLEQQESGTRAYLDAIPFRSALRSRLEPLLRYDVTTEPIERGGRYFFYKRRADQEVLLLCMREGEDGEDQVLLDPHVMSDDLTTTVTLMGVSEDGELLAYGIRLGGEDEQEVRFLNVLTREESPLRLPKDRYSSIHFAPGGGEIFYCIYGGNAPRVYRRGLDPGDSATTIFGEGCAQGIILFPELSEDGRWLLINVWHGSAPMWTEIHLIDVASAKPARVIVDAIQARFTAILGGEHLYITTNWKAPNGRIFRAELADPDLSRWTEIIPERPDVIVRHASAVGGMIACNVLENVVSRLELYSSDGRLERTIAGPAMGTTGPLWGRWSQRAAYYSFSSFHIPTRIYRLDTASGASRVWWKSSAPVEPDSLVVRQVVYASKDGTRIPMFLCHRKDLAFEGRRPVYLTGYGGFMNSLEPAYAGHAVAWALAGGVYAQPSLRGGGEYGEAWHQAGMRDKKQNTFDDMIAAAEHLIAEGITRPEHLAIAGGSNGGLLVGAVLTQRPDLARAVLCTYPLLDMVRYHLFRVARFWVPEYGSSEDPEEFRWLLAYSPYHRLVDGADYPAVLFMTGEADTRVDPLHARKMAARLQAATGSGRPVLLHYTRTSGHSGGRPMRKIIDDAADSLSFLMAEVGLRP